MAKQKLTYWVTDNIHEKQRLLAQSLRRYGFEVDFVSTAEHLLRKMRERRSAYLILSPSLGEADFHMQIANTLAFSELQGVRCIVVPTHTDLKVSYYAAATNARDVLPLWLPVNQWSKRFIYAMGGNENILSQVPGTIRVLEKAGIALPARVTALSHGFIRLETSIHPTPGSLLHFSGPFNQHLKTESLAIEVVSTRKSFLSYRFSNSIVAKWRVKDLSIEDFYESMRFSDHTVDKNRARAFLAIQNTDARRSLVDQLKEEEIEVSVALKQADFQTQPRFFSPEIVFIQDEFVGTKKKSFLEMMQALDPHCPLVVLGEKFDKTAIRQMYPHRRIIVRALNIKKSLPSLLNRYLKESYRDRHAFEDQPSFPISSTDSFSFGELKLTANLENLNPAGGIISCSHHISPYALIRLDVPFVRRFVGRSPYAKLLNNQFSSKDKADFYRHRLPFLISDLSEEESQKLSHGLSYSLTSAMAEFGGFTPEPIAMVTDERIDETKVLFEESPKIDMALEKKAAIPLSPPPLHSGLKKRQNPPTHRQFIEEKTYIKPKYLPKQKDSPLQLSFKLGVIAALSAALVWTVLNFVTPHASEVGKVFSEQFSKFGAAARKLPKMKPSEDHEKK